MIKLGLALSRFGNAKYNDAQVMTMTKDEKTLSLLAEKDKKIARLEKIISERADVN